MRTLVSWRPGLDDGARERLAEAHQRFAASNRTGTHGSRSADTSPGGCPGVLMPCSMSSPPAKPLRRPCSTASAILPPASGTGPCRWICGSGTSRGSGWRSTPGLPWWRPWPAESLRIIPPPPRTHRGRKHERPRDQERSAGEPVRGLAGGGRSRGVRSAAGRAPSGYAAAAGAQSPADGVARHGPGIAAGGGSPGAAGVGVCRAPGPEPGAGSDQGARSQRRAATIDPCILFALWLYATLEGVGSGREIARRVREHDA